MVPELQALSRRLEDLEKQVAHLEAVAVEYSDTDLTVAARTVNAQKFIVTDAQGIRRAELSMVIPEGQTSESPWLGLFDPGGRVRACLGVQNGLPWLEFYDRNQKSVLSLAVTDDGPEITFYDKKGSRRVVAHLNEHGRG